MIKGVLNNQVARPTILIGLEAGNITKLKEGKPIHFHAEEIGIEGYDVMLVYGDTKDSILHELKEVGLDIEKAEL